MASNRHSTKKTDEPVVFSDNEDALVKAYETVFAKGDKTVCACCGRKVKGDAYVMDNHTEKSICFYCLDIESDVDFWDGHCDTFIPCDDAQYFDRLGRDITNEVQSLIEDYSSTISTQLYRALQGKNTTLAIGNTYLSDNQNETEKEIRSLRAAIDLALDLGYKDDFLELSAKYNKLLKQLGGYEDGV